MHRQTIEGGDHCATVHARKDSRSREPAAASQKVGKNEPRMA